MRLVRQALQLRAPERVNLQESLVADGLEGYCVSRYFPNNLHVVVGPCTEFACRVGGAYFPPWSHPPALRIAAAPRIDKPAFSGELH